MGEKEMVLDIGIAGGGYTIYRTPLGTGGWQFHVESTGWDFDENDDDVSPSLRSEPLPTIQEALRSFGDNGEWIFLSPLSIHQDYRKVVWELVQEIARTLPQECPWLPQHPHGYWKYRCLEKS